MSLPLLAPGQTFVEYVDAVVRTHKPSRYGVFVCKFCGDQEMSIRKHMLDRCPRAMAHYREKQSMVGDENLMRSLVEQIQRLEQRVAALEREEGQPGSTV